MEEFIKIKSKIKPRCDTEDNWGSESADDIFDGELIFVRREDGSIGFKLGCSNTDSTLKSFSELDYVDEPISEDFINSLFYPVDVNYEVTVTDGEITYVLPEDLHLLLNDCDYYTDEYVTEDGYKVYGYYGFVSKSTGSGYVTSDGDEFNYYPYSITYVGEG